MSKYGDLTDSEIEDFADKNFPSGNEEIKREFVRVMIRQRDMRILRQRRRDIPGFDPTGLIIAMIILVFIIMVSTMIF